MKTKIERAAEIHRAMTPHQMALHIVELQDALELSDARKLSILLEGVSEVIRFCVEDLPDDEAAIFLRLWSDADWDNLRREFPEAADLVYSADPNWQGWGGKALDQVIEKSSPK